MRRLQPIRCLQSIDRRSLHGSGNIQDGALDLPDARLLRVAFEDCRCDEVDTRGLKASGVDLRGLDALSFTSPAGLAGVTIDDRQAAMHAREFAEALGIRVAS